MSDSRTRSPGKVYFVSGIDTGIGKTFATGAMLRWLLSRGIDVVSMKLVQTGCDGEAEDLAAHVAAARAAQASYSGEPPELAAPQIFKFPASPALAARLEGRRVDTGIIACCAATLAARHDVVLAEGAGGLLVPLEDGFFAADLAAREGWPLVLVTCGRLGSLNHTLLSLEAAKSRGMDVAGVVFNDYPPSDVRIAGDTRNEILRHMVRLGFRARIAGTDDFSAIFQ